VAKLLPPIALAGTTYRVLRLDGGARGPRFLLRSDRGDLFGLYAHNGQPTRLFAAPLVMNLGESNPLERVDFFETAGRLRARS
jgi:hypothetical protein